MSPRRSMLRVRNLADRLIGRAEPETEDRSERPTVSVIVPYYNVEAYLAECLDSVCNQTYTDFEVLLVDDGSPDGSREVAERYCATDERLRLLTRPNGGLGAARNTGIRHAKGKYLTFVDSDDRLPPRALVTLVESAERTGSDIVVGSVMRFDSRREWMPGWTDVVHRQERPAVAVVDHPEILRNLYTWNKLFRRDFWDRQELWFREGVAYEDQPIITQLYARADRIDILPEAVYEYRARDDRSSISQQTATLPDLRDRIQAWELSREALKGVVDDRIWYGWLQTLFDTHFHWYLTSPGTADEEYWRLFTTAVRSLAADAPPEIWAATAPDKRVRIALALAGRKQDAQEFVRQHPADRRLWPAEVDDRGVTLQLPLWGDPGLDPELFRLLPAQLELAHQIERLLWQDGADGPVLEISGWAYLTKIDLRDHEQDVRVVLVDDTGGELVVSATSRESGTYPPPVQDDWCDYTGGAFTAHVPFADILAPNRSWHVELRVQTAGFAVQEPVTRVVRSGSAGLPSTLVTGPTEMLTWRWREPQVLTVAHVPRPAELVPGSSDERAPSGRSVGPGVEAHAIEIDAGGRLHVSGTVSDHGTQIALQIGNPQTAERAAVRGEFVDAADGTFRAVLDLRAELYRFGPMPLGVGKHDVTVRVRQADGTDDTDGAGTELPLQVSTQLAELLPMPISTDRLEGRVVCTARGGLRLVLVRPLGQDAGRFRQAEIQRAIRPEGDVRRAVLMSSYGGDWATDSGVAIQRELQRRGSDLPVYWAVKDHARPVPEGGIPVIVDSREYHELLSSAKYYIDNTFQPEFHRKRVGQVLVQTFHGYPFKQMGHTHWRNMHFSQAKIESHVRRVSAWDYLVSPARYATPLLTREFDYTGEVLEIGYPRNDVLLSARGPAIRELVRESLGITADRTAVLYAPTRRDYLPESGKGAQVDDFLEIDRAAQALGPDHVILVRGHAFSARAKQRPGSRAGVINVTDYPEVTDLYLAADVAVVDYSSVRFDFALTGKPMLFCVPDLERYRQTRGWLFDLESTAPGPLLTTTDEVIDALRRPDEVSGAHASAYQRFRDEFLDLEDGHAAARFVDRVMVPRGDAPADRVAL